MPLNNNFAPVIESDEVNWGELGIATATITIKIGRQNAVAYGQAMKDHPRYPFLKRTDGEIVNIDGVYGQIKINFTGIDPDQDGQVKTSIKAANSTEPIDTHPNFFTFAPTHDAKYNPDGTFKSFPPKLENGDPNPMAGIEQYIEPAVTYEQTKVFAKASKQRLIQELENVGFIDDNFWKGRGIPKPPKPEGDDGKLRNWLLVSGDYNEIGDGGTVKKVWRLSGRRGWDKIIYTR